MRFSGSFCAAIGSLLLLVMAGCTTKDTTDPKVDELKTQLAAIEKAPTVQNSIDMTLIAVPPGEFTMGSPADEANRDTNEDQKQVTIERPFYLSKYEVTQAQYEAVMGSNPSRFKGPTRPVETVSFEDAKAFTEKLSQKEGVRYRLPTEAEWEYAARGGTVTAYSFGASLGPREANVRVKSADGAAPDSEVSTVEVGSYAANAWGFADMHGNVWEWTEEAMLRGGGFNFASIAARSAARMELKATSRYDCNGFRVVREVSAQ